MKLFFFPISLVAIVAAASACKDLGDSSTEGNSQRQQQQQQQQQQEQYTGGDRERFVCNPPKTDEGFVPVAESLPDPGVATKGILIVRLDDTDLKNSIVFFKSPHTYFGGLDDNCHNSNTGETLIIDSKNAIVGSNDDVPGETGMTGRAYYHNGMYAGSSHVRDRNLRIKQGSNGKLSAYLTFQSVGGRVTDDYYLGRVDKCGPKIAGGKQLYKVIPTQGCVIQYAKPGTSGSGKVASSNKVAGGSGYIWVPGFTGGNKAPPEKPRETWTKPSDGPAPVASPTPTPSPEPRPEDPCLRYPGGKCPGGSK